MAEISGNEVRLSAGEVAESVCPVNDTWIRGMVNTYGLSAILANPKMSRYVFCPEVLQKIGYEVVVEGQSEVAEGLLGSPEGEGQPEVSEASPEGDL